MARIYLPSEIQEDEGRIDTDEALQKIQTTYLYQTTRENIQKRQKSSRLWQDFTVATRKFRHETRDTRFEEYICEMVGMDDT